jgi:hypothetical protein
MPFQPILEDPTLDLPVGDKTYSVPSCDAPTGLWVTGMMTGAAEEPVELDDDDERNLYQRVLGPVYDEMLADGVPWPAFKRVGSAVLLWIAFGEGAAERYWNRDQDEDPTATPAEQLAVTVPEGTDPAAVAEAIRNASRPRPSNVA